MNVCAPALQLGVLLRVVEDELVHHLDGRRPVAQDERGGLERLQQVRELDGHDRLRLRQRHQLDGGFEHDAQRAFGADHQPRQVERLIEPARTRSGCSRRRGAGASDTGDRFRAVCAAARSRTTRQPRPWIDSSWHSGVQLRRGQIAQVRHRSVRKDDVLFEDVVERDAVQHRPRAGGIVGHHPAKRGAAGRGNVGRKPQVVRLELGVQLVEHDARLDTRGAPLDVNLQQPVDVLGGVEHDAAADGLAGLRRSSSAQRQRTAELVAEADGAR